VDQRQSNVSATAPRSPKPMQRATKGSHSRPSGSKTVRDQHDKEGTAAFADDGFGQAMLMRPHRSELSTPRSSFAPVPVPTECDRGGGALVSPRDTARTAALSGLTSIGLAGK
jgi:hypothetical protein